MKISKNEFMQLVHDVAMIKAFLMPSKKDPEGELTDWAKNELAEARKIPDSELISMEDIEKEFM